MKFHLRTLVTTATLLVTATPALAQDAEPDIFGRTGTYDLTGSPQIADIKIDQSFVMGGEPSSYPQLKGLAGAPTVELRRNYLYVEDTDGTLTIPARTGRDIGEWFNFAARELYRIQPDEFVFLVVFTTFNTSVGAFFYSPEANDIRGINSMVFDSNGASPREGFVFMNYYLAIDETFGQLGQIAVEAQRRSVFNQEIGHRWGAFIQLGGGTNGAGSDVMLGRDDGHWSFFVDSGGSPMEGNAWRDNNNGSFTTITSINNWLYSDLDLYLMGLMEPAEAAPWFVITNVDTRGNQDLTRRPLNASSPPHIISSVPGQALTVDGTRVDLTVDMVASRNGTRVPNVADSPKSYRTAIVLLGSQGSPASEQVLTQFESMVDEYAEGFEQGVRSRAALDYEFMVTPKTPIGGVCADVSECNPDDATLCLALPETIPTICTRPCDTAATCPTGWCCKELSAGSASVCATGDICIEPEPEPEPVCMCNVTSNACDANCDCDADCGIVDGICACDLTYECNTARGGGECLCDPECPAESGGCGCNDVGTQRGAPVVLVVLAFGLWVTWRRRRSER